MEQSWDNVYVDDVNTAYDAFIKIFITLYEKHCPLVNKVMNHRFTGKPWFTRGIQKACKRKNKLYKDFLRKKTKEAECTYKQYKNRLTK